jgi:hypothetical protein
MAKKELLVLVLAGTLAGGIFALPDFRLGTGVGGFFFDDFGGGYEWSEDGGKKEVKTPYSGIGGFAFFDATYVELSLGFLLGNGRIESDNVKELSYMGLDIGLLGKYPFELNYYLSIFPLLGASYRLMFSAKDGDGDEDEAPGDFSAIWFKLGFGLDVLFSYNLYLHAEALYGMRLANTYETDMVKSRSGMDPKTLLGHGLELKIAVGYKF